jgi:hypothetical protein
VVHRYTATEEYARRMLKKFRLLTRPTLARQDAPYPNKAAGERSFPTLLLILPSLLVLSPGMGAD